jgi:acetylornithine deacetylase/succinyl-diaminopimelate desuccinylase-like protein
MTSPLNVLTDFLRIPSVSTDPDFREECLRAANFLTEYLTSLGFSTQLLPGKTNPSVFAQPSTINHELPTVLIYGHYDVQPPGAPSAWTTPAFEPNVRKGRIYARGATDNKGQLMIQIMTVRELINNFGVANLPLNIKFFIEGEEEIGSPSVTSQLASHPEFFSTDYIILSDTEMLGVNQPTLDVSLRGVVDIEISIQTGSHDVHSGQFGGLAPNPAFILANLLAKLKNGRGRILLPGFYSDVIPPTFRELNDLRRHAPDTKDILKEGHFYYLGGGEPDLPLNRRRWYEPTLDITGLDSGYTGHGTKTIIPHRADAKLSIRLVPHQNPQTIYSSLVDFLQHHVSKNAVLTTFRSEVALPWRAPVNHPVYQLASDCLQAVFGRPAVLVGQGGSIGFVPVLATALGVPCVLIGFGLPDENLHAPNEHFSLDNFFKGIQVMTSLFTRLPALKAEVIDKIENPED